MTFVATKSLVDLYLPDELDIPKIPKQWIVNVCAAVLGDSFKQWVMTQVEERNILMQEKKEMMIAMDPVMAAKFSASSHVSCKCHKLLPSNPYISNYSIERCVSKHAEDEQQASPNYQAS